MFPIPMKSSSASTQNKRKHRNPFTFFFTSKQFKNQSNSNLLVVEPEKQHGLFGAPLCDASKVGTTLWNLELPDPVAMCFYEISKRGLTTEGIFRLSGATSEVSLLENIINMRTPDERKRIMSHEYDIHTLTSLVKKYLRELPEPVIPNVYHEQFQSIDLSSVYSIDQICSIITKLPFYNRQLLHAILLVAALIQQNVGFNKMCPEALATVFAPVCTGFEKTLKDHMLSQTKATLNKKYKKYHQQQALIQSHIKNNKYWTDIWIFMIEKHAELIAELDKQMQQQSAFESIKLTVIQGSNTTAAAAAGQPCRRTNSQPHSHQKSRSLSSPFATGISQPPAPSEIMMNQFYLLMENGGGSAVAASRAAGVGKEKFIHVAPPNFRQSKENSRKVGSNKRRASNQSSIGKKTTFFPKSTNPLRKMLSATALR